VLQERANPFGRGYAAYGAVFIVLSLLWGAAIDGRRPDARDGLGAAICVAGALVTMWPRG
jgi:small multidrug resistance family-3 protein